MKKILLPIVAFVVALLLNITTYAQGSYPCQKSSECFDFIYYGYQQNSNNTVTLKFGVKVNCNRDLSNAAFELPAGAKASDFSPKTGVENTTNNPFYSIKFNTGSGTKNGKIAEFSYTITSAQFAGMTSMRVQAKASTTVGTVTFDPKGCGTTNPGTPTDTPPTDGGNNGGGNNGGGNNGGGNNGGGSTGSCPDSQPRPISGNQHPCPGDIETYCIENDRGYTSFVWDVPRAHAGEPPVGWEIISGQGTNCVTVRVGEKSGTMKVKVTDPKCGTKVATLPVKPGKLFEVKLTGPDTVCTNVNQTYKATVTADKPGNGNGNGNGKKDDYTFVWTVPADWTIVSGQGTASVVVKPGTQDGEVSVYVTKDDGKEGKGNNGNGVGGTKASCGTASDVMNVYIGDDCGQVCPMPTVAIVGPDSVCAFQDEPVTFTANVANGTGQIMYTWEVPSDWTIISGQGTNSIQVQIGSESGQVSVEATSACGTSTNDTQDVFVREECGEITPLPVTLLSFEGEATKSGVLLEWATATEVNNEKFEVERSADGQSFTKVGEVKGNGNSNVKRTYSMRDARAGKGLHYYRLRQVDFDGKFEHSKVIAVDNNQVVSVASLTVAPNPVTGGQFAIRVDGAEAAQLQITDMNGRLIHSQNLTQGTSEVMLNTGSLNMRSGMYIINVKSGNSVNHAKIVVR